MKATTLFQLGGIALLIAAISNAVLDIMYFLFSGQAQTTWGQWIGLLGSVVVVFGLFALFARQPERGGILGLIGMVLVVCANIADVAVAAVGLGVAAGAFTEAQVAQVPVYASAETVIIWVLTVGQIILGISIYRAGVLPKYAGALLALVGLIEPLTMVLGFSQPIYAILSVVAYAWLGWSLIVGKSVVVREFAPAM